MSNPTAITGAFLDRIRGLLAPLFLAATGGDIDAARDAVDSMLVDYHARTDDELRLAALSIAFGFGALDALGQAARPGLAMEQVLRLRNNATALSRAGHQHQAVLDKRHKQEAAKRVRVTVQEVTLSEAADIDEDLAARFARDASPGRGRLH